ncbi:hypothetical protein A4X09_0g4703 [Tilletia walkeri]|uniref:ferric-chelate reductase (NADPH) n=1 Tax=Tilletia walkeri TaxID=117179 RepID=A0A8X7T4B3_9BASI|nr:hypothetical protein A4X09_0g4703 [Tilletia walkeri]
MGSVYVPPAMGDGSNRNPNPTDLTRAIQYNYVRNYMLAHILSWPSYRYIYLQTIIFALAFLIIGIMHHFQVHDRSVLGVKWNKWATKNRVIKLGRKEQGAGGSSSAPMGGSKNSFSISGMKDLHRQPYVRLDNRGQLLYPDNLPQDNSAPPPPTQPAVIDGVQTAFSYPPSAVAAARARAKTLNRATIHSDEYTDDDHASIEGNRGISFFTRLANIPRWLFRPSFRAEQRHKRQLSHSRRRASTRSKRRVIEFPPLGRIIVLFFVTAVPVILCLVGADYVNPNSHVFDFRSSWVSGNNAYLYSIGGIARRQPVEWGLGRYPSITTNPAGVTLPYHDWWSSGNRVGDFAFALTPLVVLVALKQVPWALLSTKWMGGLAFDKLSFLHQWVGRMVWVFATVHVGAWSVQLGKDQQYNMSMWNFIFWWVKFRWGFVAYIFLTLLMFLSLSPFRMDTYEWFYVAHVVCAFMFMLTAALHHPPLWPWMGAPLILWALERGHRAIKVMWVNDIGFLGRKRNQATPPGRGDQSYRGCAFAEVLPGQTVRLTLRTPHSLTWRPGQYVNLNVPGVAWWQSHPFTIASASNAADGTRHLRFRKALSRQFGSASFSKEQRAQMLEGKVEEGVEDDRTMVLIIRARQGFTLSLWEHICKLRYQQIETAMRAGSLAAVPQKHQTGVRIRAIVDGPYGSTGRIHWGAHSTVMIICGGSGVSFGLSVLEYLCAAMAGHAERARRDGLGEDGGIRGSTSSTSSYSSTRKGSPPTSGLDDDRRAFVTRRIRFVWILREFVHLQWAASALRRCIGMLSPEQLQVDIFVTHLNDQSHYERRGGPGQSDGFVSAAQHGDIHAKMVRGKSSDPPGAPSSSSASPWMTNEDSSSFVTLPRTPDFGPNKMGFMDGSTTSFQATTTTTSTLLPTSYDSRSGATSPAPWSTSFTANERAARFTEGPEQDEYEVQAEDLTEFDGEAGTHELSKAEREMNERVQKEGKLRRANTRKLSMKIVAGRGRGRGRGRGMGGGYGHGHGVAGSGRSGGAEGDLGLGGSEGDVGFGGGVGVGGGNGYLGPAEMAAFSEVHGGAHLPSSEPLNRGSRGGRGHNHTTGGGVLNKPLLDRHQHGGDEMAETAIDLDEQEDEDMRLVAELARPGHPKLDKIVGEECEGSLGRVMISSCGPASLGTVLRAIATRRMDVEKVRRGDLRFQVNVVTESFDWGGS